MPWFRSCRRKASVLQSFQTPAHVQGQPRMVQIRYLLGTHAVLHIRSRLGLGVTSDHVTFDIRASAAGLSLIERIMAPFRPCHGIAGPSQLHSLALPLCLSVHYDVSISTAITACFSVSSPPPPSLSPAVDHPLSGRHPNLALPYISCDARVNIKPTLPLKPRR
ncbi:hypothetical protein BCR34DRAFT_284838 [Clohesyomyces aquaticus]|uniref:Uncharacterized protein n=1 Tax=Clohesyomyces aquaticus TaxID=1231657 RepID=A0A1Y1ZRE7_9PLEO|nr:hypothetical protein BCR34DRAFT_284838 [Clohesyomyces aquaticus]